MLLYSQVKDLGKHIIQVKDLGKQIQQDKWQETRDMKRGQEDKRQEVNLSSVYLCLA